MKTTHHWSARVAITCLLIGGNVTSAHLLTISDGNASLTVDPHTVTADQGNIVGGMIDWTTDGVNDLYEQSWHHRIGDAQFESHLATLALIHEEVHGTNEIHLTYSGSGLNADVLYTLNGGPANSGTSTITETVVLTNLTTAGPLPVVWFEYDDFDIPEFSTNIASGGVNGITQQNQIGDRKIIVTPQGPTPDLFQISEAGVTQTLRDSLDDNAITTLSNGDSPFGPLDVDFAFQWNLTIPSGGAVTIVKTKVAVPEPSTLALISIGFLGLLAARCRRK